MFRSRLLSRLLLSRCSRIDSVDYVRPLNETLPQRLDVRTQGTVAIEDSYVKKFMKAVGWMNQSRTRLKLSGYFLYECIPNKVNYEEWFEKCQLPDTFASWFNVTELHVWVLMVRCMAEDVSTGSKEKYVKEDGYFIRNCIVEALWADVANRIKLLEGANPTIARKQVAELSEQFQAALVGYDEGLDDDRVLAAAVWRRLYAMDQETCPENVERIIRFMRHQMSLLDKLPSQQLKGGRPDLEWLSIK